MVILVQVWVCEGWGVVEGCKLFETFACMCLVQYVMVVVVWISYPCLCWLSLVYISSFLSLAATSELGLDLIYIIFFPFYLGAQSFFF